MTTFSFAPGVLEVIWQRLLTALEEASWMIVRTSLSQTVRESHDFGCLLYDPQGRLVAQNTTVAAKIGVFHTLLPHVFEHYAPADMRPGDVFICNDPWLTEGHLFDVSVTMPIFQGERIVAFVECIAHVSDIGGSLSHTVEDIYGEGLQIPVCRLLDAGRENDVVVRFIEKNVRVPDSVMADLRALVSSLFAIGEKCCAVADEYELANFDAIFEQMLVRSERAVRAGIAANLKPGVYCASVCADGVSDEGLLIQVCATVGEDSVALDFSGTASQVNVGINACFNYAYAWAAFAVRTMTEFSIPNNLGCMLPIAMYVPEGAVINPTRTAPVRNRAALAHFIPQVVAAALSQASSTRAMAQSGSPLWVHRISGRHADGRRIAAMMTFNGGMGARTGLDGPSAMSFPTNAKNIPIELLEATLPLRFETKCLLPDSGGPGRWRGGCGQRVVFRVLPDGGTLRVLYLHERLAHPARGQNGGLPGRCGKASLNGVPLHAHGEMALSGGDVVELQLPGGGGFGDPGERDARCIEADVLDGFVSIDAVRGVYTYPNPHAKPNCNRNPQSVREESASC